MGPLLKGAGALWFLGDVWLRGSPLSYLLFAVCDGTLALWTLAALARRRGPDASRLQQGVSGRP
jgi:hypothetical protein